MEKTTLRKRFLILREMSRFQASGGPIALLQIRTRPRRGRRPRPAPSRGTRARGTWRPGARPPPRGPASTPGRRRGRLGVLRVFLDIGAALDVPPPLLAKYEGGGEGKHAATSELMELIESALSAVTTSAPDYETLEFFWTLRRLTQKRSEPLSLGQQVAFARRFAVGYDAKFATPHAFTPRFRRT